MKIKFTHDFRGKLTQERFYLEGTEIEIEAEAGAELVQLGHAVNVEEPEPEPPVEDKPKPRRASKPKKAVDDDVS